MTPERKRILIVVPDKLGWMRVELGPLMVKAERLNHQAGYPWHFESRTIKNADTPFLAFNVAATAAVEEGYEKLWIWDSDQAPNLCCFETTALLETDIVAVGLRNWIRIHEVQRSLPAVLSGFRDAPGERLRMLLDHPSEEPYAAATAQTGGMLIDRRVLEDARMLTEPRAAGEPLPLFSDIRAPGGRPTTTCDVDFCERAETLGYRILVDPRAHSDHFKLMSMNDVADFGRFCLQLARDEQQRVGGGA